jgi:hypothetical protein
MSWRREWWVPAPQRCKLVFRRCSRFESGRCRLSSPRLRCSAGVRSALVSPLGASVGGHFEFTIWFFVRRVRGAARAETVLDYGFILGDEEIHIAATGRFGPAISRPRFGGNRIKYTAPRTFRRPVNRALHSVIKAHRARHSTRVRFGAILGSAPFLSEVVAHCGLSLCRNPPWVVLCGVTLR